VLAFGGPTPADIALPGGHGGVLAAHDARTGESVLTIRDLTSMPIMLVSEPPPEPT
jgi:hypothetical protein